MQRAQMILKRAMVKMAKDCGLRHDWATFIVITQCVTTAVLAELIPSDKLMADGGEAVVRHFTAQFESMLRQDFAGRIEHDLKQTRQ
jgi:hypothetical protein